MKGLKEILNILNFTYLIIDSNEKERDERTYITSFYSKVTFNIT